MAEAELQHRKGRSGGCSVLDVARHAKVSAGTVSRVFNGNTSVNPELRERVMRTSRMIGFVPKSRNSVFAVITGRYNPDFSLGYVAMVTALIAQELAKRHYAIEMVDIESLDLAYQAHVDGVLGVIFDKRIVKLCDVPHLPILTFNCPMLEHGIHSVSTNHYQQVILSAEHLLARGHRKIAYIDNTFETWGGRERYVAYKASLSKAGVDFDPTLAQATIGQSLYDMLARLVKKGITALLNFSEDGELEVLHILTNILGISIPNDLSVVSMENLPVFQYLTPPQSVIRQPLAEMVRIGVDKMISLSEGVENVSDEPLNIMLPCELIERDSVK